jgi:hypothetical protein
MTFSTNTPIEYDFSHHNKPKLHGGHKLPLQIQASLLATY